MHRSLVSDDQCQSRYRQVILNQVKKGDRVLDLGTGTGIHALFACQAGASRVYAIELDEMIELAKEISRANGFEDRIVFIKGLSSQVRLPEPVDVIVAHLGFEGSLRFLIDATRRSLREGGVVVPSRLDLWCVPLEWPNAYDEVVAVWERRHHGLDFSPMRGLAVNEAHRRDFTPGQYVSEPQCVSRLDLLEARGQRIGGKVSVAARRQAVLHGVGAWCTMWLDEETPLATEPLSVLPGPLLGQSFFPIERPVEVRPGDRIDIKMRAFASPGAGVVWSWEVQIDGPGRKATFAQSTFKGLPLSRESLDKQRPGYAPPLTPLGRAAHFTLALCGDGTSLGEIEHKVLSEFGALFRTREDAATFVAGVLRRYAT